MFKVLLDIKKRHEPGTSAELSVDPLQRERYQISTTAVEKLLNSLTWVTTPIPEIYAKLRSLGVVLDALGARDVLLNQCLASMAAKATLDGTEGFLYSNAVVASTSVCKARVWCIARDEATAVFRPCLCKCDEKVGYCKLHLKKFASVAGLPCGDWDPGVAHFSVPPAKRRDGRRRARFRWDAAMRRDDVVSCLRVGVFDD